jgi:hypothetical protein
LVEQRYKRLSRHDVCVTEDIPIMHLCENELIDKCDDYMHYWRRRNDICRTYNTFNAARLSNTALGIDVIALLNKYLVQYTHGLHVPMRRTIKTYTCEYVYSIENALLMLLFVWVAGV